MHGQAFTRDAPSSAEGGAPARDGSGSSAAPAQESSLAGRLSAAFSIRRNLRFLLSAPAAHERPIDGLRAIAILWVLGLHSLSASVAAIGPEAFAEEFTRFGETPWLRWIVRGDFGVDLFFVLSGYLIASILMDEREKRGAFSLGTFYVRRFMRLMPVYWLTLLLYCGVGGPNCDAAWANLIYINNYLPSQKQCMSWTWSLAVEEHFYIAFPFFLLLLYRLERRRLLLLGLLLAAAVAIRAYVIGRHDAKIFSLSASVETIFANMDIYYTKTHMRFGGIVCGVIAAYLARYSNVKDFFARHPRTEAGALAGAGLAIALAVFLPIFSPEWPDAWDAPYLVLGQYVFSAAAAVVLLAVLFGHGAAARTLAKALSARAFYPIAQLAYSAYLVNLIVIFTLYMALELRGPIGMRIFPLYVADVALTLLVSSLLYLFVERPVMNLRPRSG